MTERRLPTLRLIGRFREIDQPGDPYIRDSIGVVAEEERPPIAAYLDAGVMIGAVPGLERDVLGGPEYFLRSSLLTDGEYVWRSHLSHYVSQYGVGVPDDLAARAARGEVPGILTPEQWTAVSAWLQAEES